MWYQGTIRHYRLDDKGNNKTINETYLVSAVSYTDAEAKMHQIASEIPEFQVTKLSQLKLSDVFFVNGGSKIWYKAKVQYIVYDERTQVEKKVFFNMLINAENIIEAHNLLKERLGTIQDYEIIGINITNILDVIFKDS